MMETDKNSDRNRYRFETVAQIIRELRVLTGKTNIMTCCNISTLQSRQRQQC